MKQLALKTLAWIWLVVVAIAYFQNHTYYKDASAFLVNFLELTTLWGVAVGIVFLPLWRKKKKSIRLSWIGLVLGGWVLTWLSGILIYAAIDPGVLIEPYQLFFEGQDIAAVEEGARVQGDIPPNFERGDVLWDWSSTYTLLPAELQVWFYHRSTLDFALTLGKNMALTLGFLMGWGWFFLALGGAAFREKPLTGRVIFQSMGLGMAVSMGILFGLGWLNQLTSLAATITFGVLFVAGLPQWKRIYEMLRKAHVEYLDSWATLENAAYVVFGGIVLGLSFLNIQAPFPHGFDSLHVYHNTSRLIAYYGGLIGNTSMYNTELLVTWALLMFKSPQWGMTMIFGIDLLALALLWKTLRQKYSVPFSTNLTLIFLSLPMTQFFLHEDPKMDFALFFFALLAIQSFLHREWKWVGLWLGIAFGIKYTAVLLFATVLAAMGWEMLGGGAVAGASLLALAVLGFEGALYPLRDIAQNKLQAVWVLLGIVGFGMLSATMARHVKKAKLFLKNTAIVFGIAALVVLPWGVWRILNLENPSITAILNGEKSGLYATILTEWSSSACSEIYPLSDLEKYTGNLEVSSLWLPAIVVWESTVMSKLPNTLIADIGFLFLGSVVFFAIGWRRFRREDPSLKPILAWTLYYGALWLVTGQGIIWYGLPLFAGVFILLAKPWQENRWLRGVLVGWLGLSLLLQLHYTFTNNQALLYSGGVTDETLYMEQMESGLTRLVEIVNAPDAMEENVLLLGGTFTQYYIEENDRRTYKDDFLDAYACILSSDNPQATLERFRTFDIGYIVFSKNYLGAELDKNGPIHERFANFEVFALNNLVEEFHTSNMTLYRVPESNF